MRYKQSCAGRVANGYGYEENDCTVMAIKHAFGVTYKQSHNLLRRWGRKDKQGYCYTTWLLTTRNLFGKKQILYNFFKANGVCKDIREFVKENPKGIFILHFKNHVCTVKNGTIYDSVDILKLNYKIYKAYEVVDF